MREDKILELLNRKGTNTTKVPSPINRASAIDQSIFEPKKITVYNKQTNIDRFLNLPTRQLPPVVTRTPTSVTSTLPQFPYLLTEAGDQLITEDNDNIIL